MPNTLILYGIPHCDTVKKARRWLDKHQIMYSFFDYRGRPISLEILQEAWQQFGWALVNKRSTTWRNLPVEVKENLNEKNVLSVLEANPTLIKRPLILEPALLGFKEADYQKAFGVGNE